MFAFHIILQILITAYIDYMDLAVHCLIKAVKFDHWLKFELFQIKESHSYKVR